MRFQLSAGVLALALSVGACGGGETEEQGPDAAVDVTSETTPPPVPLPAETEPGSPTTNPSMGETTDTTP